MESVNDPKLRAFIEKTRATLGPFIKYPRLEYKYLQKPPFLFIHDIVTYVIRNHGFLNGLFTNEELNRNIVKTTKERRADFLKKLVLALRTVSGDRIPDCNWCKLASGSLPLLSNLILHSIANALAMKMNCGLAVKKLTGGLDPNPNALAAGDGVFASEKRKLNSNNYGTEVDMDEVTEPSCSESQKRPRPLTLWDLDVEDEEFIDNFEALNHNIAQQNLAIATATNSKSTMSMAMAVAPEYWQQMNVEFESMDLS